MRYLLLLCCLSLMACQKEALQHQADIQQIKDYLSSNNLTATEEPTANFFYHFMAEGQGLPVPDDIADIELKVLYKAYLLDGTVIHDSNGQAELVELDNSIYGWQLAVPRMVIGDKLLLLLPSRLAYGEEGQGAVPSNAVLIFEIELLDIYPHF